MFSRIEGALGGRQTVGGHHINGGLQIALDAIAHPHRRLFQQLVSQGFHRLLTTIGPEMPRLNHPMPVTFWRSMTSPIINFRKWGINDPFSNCRGLGGPKSPSGPPCFQSTPGVNRADDAGVLSRREFSSPQALVSAKAEQFTALSGLAWGQEHTLPIIQFLEGSMRLKSPFSGHLDRPPWSCTTWSKPYLQH